MDSITQDFDWENNEFDTSDEAYDAQILEMMQQSQEKMHLRFSFQSTNSQNFSNNIVKFNKFPDNISN